VSNTYQNKPHRAQPDPMPAEVAVPGQVIVSMAEVAESAKEGLLALAVGTGLQVMAAMFAEDVARLCGPGGKHNPERAGYRGRVAGVLARPGRRGLSGVQLVTSDAHPGLIDAVASVLPGASWQRCRVH
jgi:hypothetical protein